MLLKTSYFIIVLLLAVKFELSNAQGSSSALVASIEASSAKPLDGNILILYCRLVNLRPGEQKEALWYRRDPSVNAQQHLIVTGTKVVDQFGGRLTASRRGDDLYLITFKPIYREDRGIYRCELSDTEARVYKEHTVEVFSMPEFTVKPQSESVRIGGRAEFTCRADGYPKPSITWSRANDQFLPNGGQTHNEEVLVLENIQKEHRGVYKCTAVNEMGEMSIVAEIQVSFAPIIVCTDKDVTQYGNYDVDAEVNCIVEGYPTPTFEWYFLDESGAEHLLREQDDYLKKYRVDNSGPDDLRSSRLIIANIVFDDRGTYVLKAINELGTARGEVGLKVRTDRIGGSDLTCGRISYFVVALLASVVLLLLP